MQNSPGGPYSKSIIKTSDGSAEYWTGRSASTDQATAFIKKSADQYIDLYVLTEAGGGEYDTTHSEKVSVLKSIISTFKFTSSSESINLKTYSNADYSFKYPSDWTLSSDASGVTLDTPGVKASDHFDNDRPYAITVTNTSLSKLDVQNLGITNLKDYLDKYSSLSDPVIKNVTSLKIGDTNGYKAEAGPNQFGGGNYYYVETNNKVVQIWVFVRTQDIAVNQILSTFEFAK